MARIKSTTLYEGKSMEFDRAKFHLEFRSYCQKNQITLTNGYTIIANKIGITPGAVKKWDEEKNGPANIQIAIHGISSLFEIDEKDLLMPAHIYPREG